MILAAHSLDTLTRAIDIAASPTMIFDLSARVVHINAAAERLLGRTDASLRGEPVDVILPEELLVRVPGLVAGVIDRGRLEGAFPVVHADGTALLVDVVVDLVATDAGDARWMVATLRDLGDQIRTIEQLSRSALGAADGDEDDVIAATVKAARRLLGASYAAMQVIEDGRPSTLVTDGVGDEVAREIGHPPVGLGLLAPETLRRGTVRLADRRADPRSVALPPGHPPMTSFLGTPVEVDGVLYGHLYLTDKQGAPEFSLLDERLVELFAAHAAIALRHQRQTRAFEASLATLRRNERRMAEAERVAGVGSWEWDIASGVVSWSDEHHRIFGLEPGTFEGTEAAFLALVHPDDRAALAASDRSSDVPVPPYEAVYRIVRPDGSIRLIREAGTHVWDPVTGRATGLVGTSTDITDAAAADEERARLVSAVEQAADSILISRPDLRAVYVNPSFVRLYGFTLEDMATDGAALLDSGVHTPAFWTDVWSGVRAGRTWSGSIVNRRKDGHHVHVTTVISPVLDATGMITSFVQTDRDVTRERELESAIARDAREREMLEAAIERIDPHASLEDVGAIACAAIVEAPGVDAAWLVEFVEGRGRLVARVGPYPLATGQWIPDARAAVLIERAARGPWSERWESNPEYATFGEQLSAAGIRDIAVAPLRGPNGVFGVLEIANIQDSPNPGPDLVDRLAALATYASMLAARAGTQLAERERTSASRSEIERILAARSMRPFFQPIVDLYSGEVAGHEALTRFDDGRRPDVVFGIASTAGLGVELETAAIAAALDASSVLPPGTYLTLNVSPQTINAAGLRAVLEAGARSVVLELTEHDVIEDYSTIRADLGSLGPNVRLAVDDAGAGYASLRHILELKPDFVKLDMALVHRINRDPARQALIAGIGYFATKRRFASSRKGSRPLPSCGPSRNSASRSGRGTCSAGRETPRARAPGQRRWRSRSRRGVSCRS